MKFFENKMNKIFAVAASAFFAVSLFSCENLLEDLSLDTDPYSKLNFKDTVVTPVSELYENKNEITAFKHSKTPAPEGVEVQSLFEAPVKTDTWVDSDGKTLLFYSEGYTNYDKPVPFPEDCENLFKDCSSLKEIDTAAIDVSHTKDLSYAFAGNENLTSLNLSNFDTHSVTTMEGMFSNCSNLKEINLSNFETTNVTTMEAMFMNCAILQELDLSSFNTSRVTTMDSMFSGCSSLVTIYVSVFVININVTTVEMFKDCTSLVGENGTSYDANATDGSYAGVDGDGSEPGYFTQKITDGKLPDKDGGMVDSIFALAGLFPIGTADVFSYNDQITAFKHSTTPPTASDNAKWLSASGNILVWLSSDGKTAYFYAKGYTDSGHRVPLPDRCIDMFSHCTALKEIEMKWLDTRNVIDMESMFRNCESLEEIDLSNFSTENVSGSMTWMFMNCKELTSINLSKFNTSKVDKMDYMFSGCSNLSSIDVSSFDTSSVQSMGYMFTDCSALKELNLSNFDTQNVGNMDKMFGGCESLVTLDVSSFNTSNVTSMYGMFMSCKALKELNLTKFDTKGVMNMVYMFNGCSSLATLDLSSFNISNMTFLQEMFASCGNLTTIYASSDWSSSDVGYQMFFGCENLKGGSGTEFNSDHIGVEYARIDGGESSPGYFTKK